MTRAMTTVKLHLHPLKEIRSRMIQRTTKITSLATSEDIASPEEGDNHLVATMKNSWVKPNSS